MDGKKYSEYLEKFATAKALFCTSCGTETPALGSSSFCSSCENMVDSTLESVTSSAPNLSRAVAEIKNLVDGGDFDGAIAAYKGLDPKMEDASLLYAQALVYIRYSNSVLGSVNYTKEGFMYENTDIRDKSLALISLSKRMLARAIVLLTDSISKASNYRQSYLLFLCQMKFDKLRGAVESMAALDKSGQVAIASYARLLFDAKTGELRDMAMQLQKLETGGTIFLNALFYYAYLDLKEARHGAARIKLAGLSQYAESHSVEALMEEIKNAAAPE